MTVWLQYAPFALALLGTVFLRTRRKGQLALAAAALFLGVGVFDAVTWNDGPFESYVTDIRFNLVVGEDACRGESRHQFLVVGLGQAGAGLGALCAAGAARSPRRYGFLVALIAMVVAVHSLQAHKEYRFVFAVVPLWLLVGADLAARLAASPPPQMGRGIGGGRFGRRLRRWHREPASVPGPAVSRLVQRNGRRGLPGRAGPDLRCPPPPRSLAGGRIGVAGRPHLRRRARLLLPAPGLSPSTTPARAPRSGGTTIRPSRS